MKTTRAVYQQFQALVTRGKSPAAVETLNRGDLPAASTVRAQPGECDLLVKVQYSNLNYKDALVVTGKYPGLKPPMIGGIDLVGSVLETKSSNLKVGQTIVVNGWGIGTDHFGGYAGEARLRSDWAIPLPSSLTPQCAAKIGTAGYTAMLCVQGLENQGLSPGDGPILVTGATGGVGSVSVLLLSQLGYEVIAVSGKAAAEAEYLKSIGASQVLERSEFEVDPKPLGKERFAGCVDSCGGKILANVLTLTKSGGAVSACGLAGGMPLNTTVAPFILRGVTLVGIESVFLKTEKRLAAYERFSPLLTPEKLALVSGEGQTVGLGALPELGAQMLKGGVRGRYIVDLSL
jgi:acrylyl-CoA reductase (NADPH)